MQYLYTLALSHEEDQHNNILLPLLEFQNRKYERLLSLANTVGSPDVLTQAIDDAKSRNNKLKKKDDSDPVGSLSNKRTATATNASVSSSINNNNDRYKQGMDFVEQFKQARIQKGHKKMDWITCLEEGTSLMQNRQRPLSKLGLLNYKNADALRNQFSKSTKQKSKNQ